MNERICMASVSSGGQISSEKFDLWAQVYDSQPNPLLKLEERYLIPLLPPLKGREVLDVGCGTGRWLCRLEDYEPSRLVGVDISEEMLAHAKTKVGSTTELYQSACVSLSGGDRSKTFVLSSFVLSYVQDLSAFAEECHRVIESGGWIVLSDVHPLTSTKFRWKRGFNILGANVELEVKSRSIDEIVSTFESRGFELQELVEPGFGLSERSIFESAGKVHSFEELAGAAAIYVMRLQNQKPSHSGASTKLSDALQIASSGVALGVSAWRDAIVRITDDKITSIGARVDCENPDLDLYEYLLLPGLINSHDHLEFGLFPNLGRSSKEPHYLNSSEWADEIHKVHATTIARYRQIPKAVRLYWGAIRNLLCGVTTVCHHNPLYPEFDSLDFPVKVVSRYGWSHSLRFDPGFSARFHQSPPDVPFIFHSAEGVDRESSYELLELDKMQLLDNRTVLVHGLGCSSQDAMIINQRGTSLITCPTSNKFLFSKTLSRDFLIAIDRIAVGSDSSMTAAGDLLDEIDYLYSNIGLDGGLVFRMATSSPAGILRLKNGEGGISKYGTADLIAVRRREGTPASILSTLTLNEIELVIVSGRIQMASPDIYERLPLSIRSGMQLMTVDDHQRWLRAPLDTLFKAAENILGKDNLLLGGKRVRLA